ncbi:hypothetical protein KIN20_018714 [Parelaphostrongylus tenuis]|uniref:Uncharacterized protein n=1 Tax=Parelaphostrongylus tenuis TaxID=148309 RepID=A0AAD5QRS7_PARTN|nr:hypothetical protein KIN20_018714 [Parelaphostrongylus tenuis]
MTLTVPKGLTAFLSSAINLKQRQLFASHSSTNHPHKLNRKRPFATKKVKKASRGINRGMAWKRRLLQGHGLRRRSVGPLMPNCTLQAVGRSLRCVLGKVPDIDSFESVALFQQDDGKPHIAKKN